MATGTLTLALLLFSAGADPTDVMPMKSLRFQFPILPIPPDQQAKISELILYYSSDQGVTWQQGAIAAPNDKQFVFAAPADGLYWFNICVKDKTGAQDPKDISKSAPRGKVLVDTVPPNVRILAADRKASADGKGE